MLGLAADVPLDLGYTDDFFLKGFGGITYCLGMFFATSGLLLLLLLSSSFFLWWALSASSFLLRFYIFVKYADFN